MVRETHQQTLIRRCLQQPPISRCFSAFRQSFLPAPPSILQRSSRSSVSSVSKRGEEKLFPPMSGEKMASRARRRGRREFLKNWTGEREKRSRFEATMAVIIVDAEISILRLMHRPETRVPLCVYRGGGREIRARNHRRVSGKLRRREPTRNHHKGSVLPLIPRVTYLVRHIIRFPPIVPARQTNFLFV